MKLRFLFPLLLQLMSSQKAGLSAGPELVPCVQLGAWSAKAGVSYLFTVSACRAAASQSSFRVSCF